MNSRKKRDWRSFWIGFWIFFLIFFMSAFIFKKMAKSENEAESINGKKDFNRLIVGEWQSKFRQDGETIVIKMVFSSKIIKEKEAAHEGTVIFSIISRNKMIVGLSVPNKLFYSIKNDEMLLFLKNRAEWGRIKIINLNGKTMELVEIDNSNGEPIQKVLTYSRISY